MTTLSEPLLFHMGTVICMGKSAEYTRKMPWCSLLYPVVHSFIHNALFSVDKSFVLFFPWRFSFILLVPYIFPHDG